MDIRELDKQYIADTYARYPVTLLCGKGALAYDDKGKEYIDMGAGIGVNAFGYADPVWLSAVIEQASTLQHVSNLYYTAPAPKLAELLCQKTGMKKAFFCNSGAEANECLLKAARKYAAGKKGAEYSTVLTIKNSFHGRTLTTLAATGQEHYHELYAPLTPGFVYAQAGDIHGVMRLCQENKVAAVFFECIQGEGGVIPLSREFVQDMASFAAEEDILVCVDEVQTGNGRTGTLFSYQRYDWLPDIATTAKGLAGGLPMGVCLLGEKVKDTLGPGSHGSTFGGNPVCAAAALAVQKQLTDDLLAEVKRKGKYIAAELSELDNVKSVSGRGLMLGVESDKDPKTLVKALLARGVVCLTAKNKLRLLPPLTIPWDALEEAVEIIKEELAK